LLEKISTITQMQNFLSQETARAKNAEERSVSDKRESSDIQARLAFVNRSLDECQVSLATERKARLESEARCTTLIHEMRKPVNFPTPEPLVQNGWKLEITGRDEFGNMRSVKLTPEE
jgi:hypothetical protein